MAPQNNDRVTSAASNKPSGSQTHLDPPAAAAAAAESRAKLADGCFSSSPLFVFPLAGAAPANCEELSSRNFCTDSKFLNYSGEKGQRVRKSCEEREKKKQQTQKKVNRFYVGVVRELSTLPYTRDSVNAKRLGVKTFFLGSFFFFPFSDFPQLQNEREKKKSNYQTRLESSLDAWDAFEAWDAAALLLTSGAGTARPRLKTSRSLSGKDAAPRTKVNF